MCLFLFIKEWHLLMYLIWQKRLSAKKTKKNTEPNVLHLQYTVSAHQYHIGVATM